MFNVIPYFNFQHSLEALDFYENKLEATIVSKVMGDNEMFKDMPDEMKMPEDVAKNFVMNAEFRLLGERFMVSDSWGNQPVNQQGTQVCFTFDGKDSEAVQQAKDFFKKAGDAGCKITMPLGPTEWTELYGEFTDPFGVSWMISAE